jgi:hypothetical protein
MAIAIAFLVVLGLVSVLTTTKESRAAASAKLAKWNPLFIAIIIAELAFIFWPWN